MFLLQLFGQSGPAILSRLTPKIDAPSTSRYHLGWAKLTILYISDLSGTYFGGRESNKMLCTERHRIFRNKSTPCFLHKVFDSHGSAE